MKNIIKAYTLLLFVLLFTGCYDRDIVDSKEFNHSLPKVENLKYTINDNKVKLTWQIPTTISADFRRPLETSIQIVENDIYRQKLVIGNENTSVDISVNVNKKYRFVVKLLGHLTNEAREDGITDRVYSQEQVIEVQ